MESNAGSLIRLPSLKMSINKIFLVQSLLRAILLLQFM